MTESGKASGGRIIPALRYRDATEAGARDIKTQDYGGRDYTARDPEGSRLDLRDL